MLTESENADIALNVYDSTGACESSRRISRATADNGWDRLTAYNGVSISYDAIGNPLSYSNGSSYSFTWENGRQLAAADCDGIEMTYEYNHDGLRTKKTVEDGETYLYYYSGDKLISMTWDGGERSLNFLYNGSTPYSMVYYDGSYTTSYYYITNIQGDVVALMSAQHVIVAEYVYDAWGNIISVTDGSGNDLYFNSSHIAHLNPIRYRGYYYDIETGFYYLQSRYYDPVVGRFINGDAYASTGTGFLGHNMYTYCLNNPVRFTDDCGNCPYDGTSADFRRLERGEPPLKCKCHDFPKKILPENEGFTVDDSYYKMQCKKTYTKTLTQNEADIIIENTVKNHMIQTLYDECWSLLISKVIPLEWLNISTPFGMESIEAGVAASNYNVSLTMHTATVAVYKSEVTEQTLTFVKRTCGLGCDYDIYGCSFGRARQKEMYGIAFPNVIGKEYT